MKLRDKNRAIKLAEQYGDDFQVAAAMGITFDMLQIHKLGDDKFNHDFNQAKRIHRNTQEVLF